MHDYYGLFKTISFQLKKLFPIYNLKESEKKEILELINELTNFKTIEEGK